MFINRSELLLTNPPALRYGIAVTDADDDGNFEFLVTGFGTRNLLLRWNGSGYVDVADRHLADSARQAIGVAAADIDADGYEELYILNTDTFAGQKRFGDRLFDYLDERYIDLFEVPAHASTINLTAGRSVAAVDRFGFGHFGFFIANYGGPMRLYELDVDGRLIDVAAPAGLAMVTGGRSLLTQPIVSQQMDILAGNENGANFLFRNRGDGTFEEVAQALGVQDPDEHARGIAALDVGNSHFAVVYGNWEGAHRLFLPSSDGHWDDIAPPEMAEPSRVRTVIAADFDNDGYQEIFFNNIGEPNRLFGLHDGEWVALDIGAASEPLGMGTGAAVADLDGDGRLELLIAHGESALQPMSLYHAMTNDNHYLRVQPLTRFGAPARGALVTLKTARRTQRRVIDAGSGYLCQMEPIAHFGLGNETEIEYVTVRWLDGVTVTLDHPRPDQLLRFRHPETG